MGFHALASAPTRNTLPPDQRHRHQASCVLQGLHRISLGRAPVPSLQTTYSGFHFYAQSAAKFWSRSNNRQTGRLSTRCCCSCCTRCAASEKKRKRIEECFGWLKTIALLRSCGIAARYRWIEFLPWPARRTIWCACATCRPLPLRRGKGVVSLAGAQTPTLRARPRANHHAAHAGKLPQHANQP
jgi:hypothetical protein